MQVPAVITEGHFPSDSPPPWRCHPGYDDLNVKINLLTSILKMNYEVFDINIFINLVKILDEKLHTSKHFLKFSMELTSCIISEL